MSSIGAQNVFVGRERNQRASNRQLARIAVVSRRVNSTVRQQNTGTEGQLDVGGRSRE